MIALWNALQAKEAIASHLAAKNVLPARFQEWIVFKVSQIAGRAGRRNSAFGQGIVTCLSPEDMPLLKKAIKLPAKELRTPSAGTYANWKLHLQDFISEIWRVWDWFQYPLEHQISYVRLKVLCHELERTDRFGSGMHLSYFIEVELKLNIQSYAYGLKTSGDQRLDFSAYAEMQGCNLHMNMLRLMPVVLPSPICRKPWSILHPMPRWMESISSVVRMTFSRLHNFCHKCPFRFM